jgi:hypothetical protein
MRKHVTVIVLVLFGFVRSVAAAGPAAALFTPLVNVNTASQALLCNVTNGGAKTIKVTVQIVDADTGMPPSQCGSEELNLAPFTGFGVGCISGTPPPNSYCSFTFGKKSERKAARATSCLFDLVSRICVTTADAR